MCESQNTIDATKKELITSIMEVLKVNYQSDNDTVKDNLKYSSWVAALATAGLAIVITKGTEFPKSNGIPELMKITGVLFLVGMLSTVSINRLINSILRLQRQCFAFLTAQGLRLIMNPSLIKDIEGDKGLDILLQIHNGHFLATVQKKSLEELHKKSNRTYYAFRIFAGIQQLAVILGYIVLFCIRLRSMGT